MLLVAMGLQQQVFEPSLFSLSISWGMFVQRGVCVYMCIHSPRQRPHLQQLLDARVAAKNSAATQRGLIATEICHTGVSDQQAPKDQTNGCSHLSVDHPQARTLGFLQHFRSHFHMRFAGLRARRPRLCDTLVRSHHTSGVVEANSSIIAKTTCKKDFPFECSCGGGEAKGWAQKRCAHGGCIGSTCLREEGQGENQLLWMCTRHSTALQSCEREHHLCEACKGRFQGKCEVF